MNFSAFESRFLSTCCRRLASVWMVSDGSCASTSMRELEALAVGHVPEGARDSNRRRSAKRTLPSSTSILPDSILQRSRMSLISASRSVPERVDGFGVLDLLSDQVLLGVFGQHLRQDQQVVERRPQLVAHVGQELATCTSK